MNWNRIIVIIGVPHLTNISISWVKQNKATQCKEYFASKYFLIKKSRNTTSITNEKRFVILAEKREIPRISKTWKVIILNNGAPNFDISISSSV